MKAAVFSGCPSGHLNIFPNCCINLHAYHHPSASSSSLPLASKLPAPPSLQAAGCRITIQAASLHAFRPLGSMHRIIESSSHRVWEASKIDSFYRGRIPVLQGTTERHSPPNPLSKNIPKAKVIEFLEASRIDSFYKGRTPVPQGTTGRHSPPNFLSRNLAIILTPLCRYSLV